MKENKRWWCAKARRSPAERPRLVYMRLLIRALRWKHGKERVGNDGCACRQHWTNLLANGQQRQLSRHCFIKATHYKSLIFTQGDSVIEAWSPCTEVHCRRPGRSLDEKTARQNRRHFHLNLSWARTAIENGRAESLEIHQEDGRLYKEHSSHYKN